MPTAIARGTGDRLRGVASFYGTGGPGQYAAMHDYIDGTAVFVVVCAYPNGRTHCETFPVVTQCGACRWSNGATLVDLSIPAYLEFGYPLSRGLIPVTVEVLS